MRWTPWFISLSHTEENPKNLWLIALSLCFFFQRICPVLQYSSNYVNVLLANNVHFTRICTSKLMLANGWISKYLWKLASSVPVSFSPKYAHCFSDVPNQSSADFWHHLTQSKAGTMCTWKSFCISTVHLLLALPTSVTVSTHFPHFSPPSCSSYLFPTILLYPVPTMHWQSFKFQRSLTMRS